MVYIYSLREEETNVLLIIFCFILVRNLNPPSSLFTSLHLSSHPVSLPPTQKKKLAFNLKITKRGWMSLCFSPSECEAVSHHHLTPTWHLTAPSKCLEITTQLLCFWKGQRSKWKKQQMDFCVKLSTKVTFSPPDVISFFLFFLWKFRPAVNHSKWYTALLILLRSGKINLTFLRETFD